MLIFSAILFVHFGFRVKTGLLLMTQETNTVIEVLNSSSWHEEVHPLLGLFMMNTSLQVSEEV